MNTKVYADFAKPGAFNDMDILEVGNTGDPWPTGNKQMSAEEWKSHYSLWIVMKVGFPLSLSAIFNRNKCRNCPFFRAFLNKK